MDVFFNELSSTDLSESKAEANQCVAKFIQAYAEAKKKGFKGIRFPIHLHEVPLSEGYSLQDWLGEASQRTLKDLLIGARRYPFIAEGETWAEDFYIENAFYIEEPVGSKHDCTGLAAAHIFQTLSISLATSASWCKNILRITVVDANGEHTSPKVHNVFSKDCFAQAEIVDFLENIGALEPKKTPILPNDKPVKFRDDHGTDVLKAFASNLVNSPYVESVINSLPFNRRAIKFIRKVFPDGKIELVLHWTDAGYGMVIQTTGTNMRETMAIAKKLEEQYGQ